MSESRRSKLEKSRLATTIDIPLTPPIAARQEAVGKKRGRQRRVLLDSDAFLPSQTQPMPSKAAPLSRSAEIERIPFTAPVLQPVNIAKEKRLEREKRLEKIRAELEATLDLFNFESFDALGIKVDDKETNPATKKMIETLELIYGLSDSLIKQIDPKDENQLFGDTHIKLLIELKNVVHALVPLHVKNTQKNQQQCATTREDFGVAIREFNSELTPEIKEHAQLVINHVSEFITLKQNQLKPTQIEERGTTMASPRAKEESKLTLAAAQSSITDILTSLTEAIDAKPYLETLVTQLDGLAYNIFTEILRLKKNDAIIRSESDFRSSISLQDTSSGLGLTDEQILAHEVGQRLIRLNTFLSPFSDVALVDEGLVKAALALLPKRFPMSAKVDVTPPALEEVKKPEAAKEKPKVKEAAEKPASASSSSSSSSSSESTEADDDADNSSEADAEEENVPVDENKSAAPSAPAKAPHKGVEKDVEELASEILRDLGTEKNKEGDADSKSESSSSSSSASKKSGEKKAAVEEKKAAKDESESRSGDEGTSSAADDELLPSEEKAKAAPKPEEEKKSEPAKAAPKAEEEKKSEPAKAAPKAKEDEKSEPAKAAPKAEDEKKSEPAKAAAKVKEDKKSKPAKAEKKEKLKVKEEAKPAMESESESSEAKKSASSKDDESTHDEESTATTEERTPAKRTKMPALDDDETSHHSKAKEKFNAFKKSAGEFKDSAKDKAGKFFNKLAPKRARSADDELAALTTAVANMEASELKTALSALAEQVGDDLAGKKEGRAKENSSAAQLIRDTNKMMDELTRTPNDGEFKDDAQYQKHLSGKVNTFKRTFSTSSFAKFGKAIAAIASALGGLIAGAVIGGGIGIAAGAWTGPGAVVTGVAGVFTGAATGAGIGLVAGATAVGITAGTVSGIFLFKKPSEAARQRHDLARKVAEEAREQAKATTLKSG